MQPTDIIASHRASGPMVVMLHGSGLGPESWDGLIGHIAARHPVRAPRLPGQARIAGCDSMLDATADAMLRPHPDPTRPIHLVGHDFGAVIALKIAARHPDRIASLTLIEPVAFNAVASESAPRILLKRLVAGMQSAIDLQDPTAAMAAHTDAMNGPGTWQRTTPGLRARLTERANRVLNDLTALADDRMTPLDLAGVVCPTLMICGGETCEPLKQVASHLHRTLPFPRVERIADAGHFPHLTDPHLVDPMIAEFLECVERQWQDNNITRRKAA